MAVAALPSHGVASVRKEAFASTAGPNSRSSPLLERGCSPTCLSRCGPPIVPSHGHAAFLLGEHTNPFRHVFITPPGCVSSASAATGLSRALPSLGVRFPSCGSASFPALSGTVGVGELRKALAALAVVAVKFQVKGSFPQVFGNTIPQ